MCIVPKGSISGPLLFNICTRDLLLKEIEVDFAKYANETTPYSFDSKIEVVTDILKRNLNKVFQWFIDKFLIANPYKCHFLTKSGEVSISIKFEKIINNYLCSIGDH